MRYMLALLVLKVLPQGVRAALLNWLTPASSIGRWSSKSLVVSAKWYDKRCKSALFS
jgi:hypothetical protein